MHAAIRKTPRQAAYQDLCAIIAQLAGRSRRAQRAMLETELVRALERAHDFQTRIAGLAALVLDQKDQIGRAASQVTCAKAEARQRVQGLRQEVLAVVDRCVSLEKTCKELLGLTEAVLTVAPPALVLRPPQAPAGTEGADDEAITERCPAPSGAVEEGAP